MVEGVHKIDKMCTVISGGTTLLGKHFQEVESK